MSIINVKALENASVADMQTAIGTLNTAIVAREQAEKDALIQEITAKYGDRFNLADLFGKAKGVRAPAAIKYRNVKTGDQWSGRGMTPKWLLGLTEAQREAYRVAPIEAAPVAVAPLAVGRHGIQGQGQRRGQGQVGLDSCLGLW